MLLERLGKFCFSKNRSLPFYLIVLVPILLGFFSLFLQYAKSNDLEERFYNACQKGKTALEKRKEKELFIQRYSHCNPYFLENEIESLTFLESEINELNSLVHHPALADKRILNERLQFLTKGANQFSFTEEAIRSSSIIKETEEKQRHPVQMNGEDLKKLLSLLEDVPIETYPLLYRNNLKNREFGKEAPQSFCLEGETIAERQSSREDKNFEENPTSPKTDSSGCFGINQRPQIVITDFRLEKKQTPLKTNVFEVEMQFIKREFIQ